MSFAKFIAEPQQDRNNPDATPAHPINETPGQKAERLIEERNIHQPLHDATHTLVEHAPFDLEELSTTDMFAVLESFRELSERAEQQLPETEAHALMDRLAQNMQTGEGFDELIDDLLEDGNIDNQPLFESIFGAGPTNQAVQFALSNLAQQGANPTNSAHVNLRDYIHGTAKKKASERLADALLQQQLAEAINNFYEENQQITDAAAAKWLATEDLDERARIYAQYKEDMFNKMRQDPRFKDFSDEQVRTMSDEKTEEVFKTSVVQQLQNKYGLSKEDAQIKAEEMIKAMEERATNDQAYAQKFQRYKEDSISAIYAQEQGIDTWIAGIEDDHQRKIMQNVDTLREDYVAIVALDDVRLVYSDFDEAKNDTDKYYIFDDVGTQVYIHNLEPEVRDQAQIDIERQTGQMFANENPDEAVAITQSWGEYKQNEEWVTEYETRIDGLYDQYSDQYNLMQQLAELDILTNIIFDENIDPEVSQAAEDRYFELQDQIDEALPSNQDETSATTEQADSLIFEAPSAEEMQREAELANEARNYADQIRANGVATPEDIKAALGDDLSPAELEKIETVLEQEGIKIENPYAPEQENTRMAAAPTNSIDIKQPAPVINSPGMMA